MSFSEQFPPITDHLTAAATERGRLVGYTESERDGKTSWAQQDDAQSGALAIRGGAPQGEEDTISCCRLLVLHLNSHGGRWGDPTDASGDVDCRVTELHDDSRFMEIQVVRATIESDFWRDLNRGGDIRREALTVEELAGKLWGAIQHKANRIEPPRRQQLVLALDATRLPLFVFDGAVECFWQSYGERARSCHFQGIWLVGPPDSRCWQLDIDQTST